MKDAKSAIRFIRANATQFGIDTAKVVAAGGSAGGHLAAATAMITGYDEATDDLSISCKPNALALFNPVIDNGPAGYGYNRIGADYKDFSPLHNVEKGVPPSIFFLGTKDDLIPVETAEYFQTTIQRVGSRCELKLYKDQPHGFFNLRNRPYYELTVAEMDVFLTDLGFLKPPLRTKYFPKQKTLVKQLPRKENLWVFLLTGQSNMAGRGVVQPQDTLEDKRIITIDSTGNWIYAKAPLHFYEPGLVGLDCGLSFAQTLLQSIPDSVTVALLPCAVGGSPIEKWLNDETHRGVSLFSNFEQKVQLAQQVGTIKGILWHQGESNARADLIPAYHDQLTQLIGKFRATVGEKELPVLIGELGHYVADEAKQARWNAINEIIHQVSETLPSVSVISTAELGHKGDYLHFNNAALRELGRRFAAAYLENENNGDY